MIPPDPALVIESHCRAVRGRTLLSRWDFTNDFMCLAGASTTKKGPGALIRGGGFNAPGGPFAVSGNDGPMHPHGNYGFRGVR